MLLSALLTLNLFVCHEPLFHFFLLLLLGFNFGLLALCLPLLGFRLSMGEISWCQIDVVHLHILD